MGSDNAAAQMPQYQCHKKVWALKIERIETDAKDGSAFLVPVDSWHYARVAVDAAFMQKHKPQPGGYYVVYPGDGYASYSPAKPFEDGYTLIAHSPSPSSE